LFENSKPFSKSSSISFKSFAVGNICLEILDNTINNFSTGNNVWDIFLLEILKSLLNLSINSLSIFDTLRNFSSSNESLQKSTNELFNLNWVKSFKVFWYWTKLLNHKVSNSFSHWLILLRGVVSLNL
jgi:hypothetical protein